MGASAGDVQSCRPEQQAEITRMVSKGEKTAADAVRLFKIHPATVSRPLSEARLAPTKKTTARRRSKAAYANSVETFVPNNSESDIGF
jgi:hypothetical protein